MNTEKEERILARVVARELTLEELEGAGGGRGGLKQVDVPGCNNSTSVTTCSHNLPLEGNHLDGGADD
jgi:hypothetical protein